MVRAGAREHARLRLISVTDSKYTLPTASVSRYATTLQPERGAFVFG